jgi:hypothetical protein
MYHPIWQQSFVIHEKNEEKNLLNFLPLYRIRPSVFSNEAAAYWNIINLNILSFNLAQWKFLGLRGSGENTSFHTDLGLTFNAYFSLCSNKIALIEPEQW